MSNELDEPKVSPAKAAYHLNQLRKLFSRAGDEPFLQMVWAIDALRSGRRAVAARLLTFPRQVADQSIGSRFAIHQWELETLLIQLLLTPQQAREARHLCSARLQQFRLSREIDEPSPQIGGGRKRNLPTRRRYHHFRRVASHHATSIPLAARLFQLTAILPVCLIYAQGKCGEYFEKTFGLPITELNLVGFALFGQSMRTPWIMRDFTIPEIGLTADLLKRALPLILISVDRAREETRNIIDALTAKHGRPIPTAFLPSILRRYPLVSPDNKAKPFVAPIPDVLLMRVTSGLYYDLIPGGQALLNEASDRFEKYSAAYIDAQMVRFNVDRAYRYETRKGAPVDTPDLLVKDGEKLVLVVECKATKLTYLAQFAEDPFEAEKKQYLQIANGVFQLWRFFSHVRRGLVKEPVDIDTSAMVLTLDPFTTADHELEGKDCRRSELNRGKGRRHHCGGPPSYCLLFDREP